MPSFNIKSTSTSDRLTIHVLRVPQTTSKQYDDWINVEVEVKAGGFNGRYGALFMAHDFLQLREELASLYNNLSGSLKFETLEGQLEFEIIGDGRGHFTSNFKAFDGLGYENQLTFSIKFDQTFIPQMLRELSEINDHTVA